MWISKFNPKDLWQKKISSEAAKKKISAKIADYAKDGDVIGVGSGSTAYLAIVALGKSKKKVICIPTSHEAEVACIAHGLIVTSLKSQKPDWCFDGADEIDANGNMIKGRGGAMWREKMVMRATKGERFILVDASKIVKTLGKNFPIPVEIHPDSLYSVEEDLYAHGAKKVSLRMAEGKDGPVITENGFFILDVAFQNVNADLERQIKSIVGVVETGLFTDYHPKIVDEKTKLVRAPLKKAAKKSEKKSK